jgi:hypothetical protein
MTALHAPSSFVEHYCRSCSRATGHLIGATFHRGNKTVTFRCVHCQRSWEVTMADRVHIPLFPPGEIET